MWNTGLNIEVVAMNPRASLVLTVSFALVACSDSPTRTELGSPVFQIADAVHNGGNPHFFFLPPMVPSPVTNGVFDGSLEPVVEICELSLCGTSTIASFTTTTGTGSEIVRVVPEDEHYIVNWHTDESGLDDQKDYRIRVLLGGTELGHADVDVVSGGNQLKNVDTGASVALLNGRTLPVKFRIEEGALLGEPVDPAGGEVSLAEGVVNLVFPPGAVSEAVFVTAGPATGLPAEPVPILGTAFDLGPDGILFDVPVTLTMQYDPANVPDGVPEEELRIHKLVDGSYIQMDAGVVDLANHSASATIDGFSVYVLLSRLFPGSPADVEAPVVLSMQVFDETAGTFGSATTLDVSAADAMLRTRINLTDNISGVNWIQIDYVSPSGRQIRFPCWPFPTDPPIRGSDTNGEWECSSTWPRYSEPGTWQPNVVFANDNVGNFVFFLNQAGGFCDGSGPDATCLTDLPEIDVTSNLPDLNAPVLLSFDVSHDVQPRRYASSITVDAGAATRPVVFRFHATDDLSGIGPHPSSHERFVLVFRGPSGQSQVRTFCSLAQGTDLDAFWECPVSVPQFAEVGTWQLTRLEVPDHVGNGGRAPVPSRFTPDGNGQLCNPDGNCVTTATVEVTGLGDGEAPVLQSLSLDVVGATVTTTLRATDMLSGTNEAIVQFNSASTDQSELCFGNLTSGTSSDGTWACDITFSEFAARGDWNLSFLTIVDVSGNRRLYTRRAADGFLCYTDSGGQVCADFGDTVIIVQ